jgi:hypothetical protein
MASLFAFISLYLRRKLQQCQAKKFLHNLRNNDEECKSLMDFSRAARRPERSHNPQQV